MKKSFFILTLVLFLVAAQFALAAPPSDPNTWATAIVSGPPEGSPAGSYSSIWTVNPTEYWPDGWLLVGVSFSPDGNNPTDLISLTQPAGWSNTLYNTSGPWLAWYANGDGTQPLTDANGLTSALAGAASWSGSYTTTGAINVPNYHLLFVNSAGGTNPNGRYEVVQSSLTAEVVPEPGTLVLLGTGLAGLAAVVRRRKQSA